jgi:hypothetical protein
MKKIWISVLLSAVIASPIRAEDIWVLQGFATSPIPGSVFAYIWSSGVLLHNATVNDATIRLIDISNGAPVGTGDRQFVVPPGRSASALPWHGNAGLWVTHIDVPQGVIVESRIRIGDMLQVGPPVHDGDRGKLSFPVYRSLQAAGTPKIHLGTDLEEIPSRNNVAVYNAGDVSAHARIEVHQLCDEALIDSRDVDIPAKTVIQATGLSTAGDGCMNTSPRYTYVAVMVDQPSLSWVSTLSNADQIKVVYAAAGSSP